MSRPALILDTHRTSVPAFRPPPLLLVRYARGFGVELQDASELFEETKKFLLVASDRSLGRVAPSKAIDEMWHLFLLFTREYADFCESIGGFVHHAPAQRSNEEAFRKARHEVERQFGEAPIRWWGAGADCDDDAGGGSCGSDF